MHFSYIPESDVSLDTVRMLQIFIAMVDGVTFFIGRFNQMSAAAAAAAEAVALLTFNNFV